MKRLLSILLCMTLLALTGCGSEQKDDTYKVAICQLIEHPALGAATEGFETALKETLGDRVVITTEIADGSRETCSNIISKYVDGKVDLIMTNATTAMVAASNLTGRIPIVATSITDYGTALNIRNWTGATGINITGTSDLAPVEELEKVILEVVPNVKNVGLIYSSGESNSIFQVNSMKKVLEADHIAYTEYPVSNSNDIEKITREAVEHCDAIYLPTDNLLAASTDLLVNIFNQAKVPTFTGEEGICSAGIATLSIDYYSIGYEAGLMACEILQNGTNPANMEIRYATEYTKKYNKANADAIGIKIPDDYKEITE